MSRNGPNWEKTGTVEGYAEWLRSKSDALCVVVIRVNDAVLAADPQLAPSDAGEKLAEHLPVLIQNLSTARAAKKKAARIEMGELHE